MNIALSQCSSVFLDELQPDGLMDLRAVSRSMRNAIDAIPSRIWCDYWLRFAMNFVRSRAESVNFARLLRGGHVAIASNAFATWFALMPPFLDADVTALPDDQAAIVMHFPVHRVVYNDGPRIHVMFKSNGFAFNAHVSELGWLVLGVDDEAPRFEIRINMDRAVFSMMLALRQVLGNPDVDTRQSILTQSVQLAYEQYRPF